MTDAEILGLDLGMQPPGQDGSRRLDPRQQVGPRDSFRISRRSHGIGSVLWPERHLAQAQGRHGLPAGPAQRPVPIKASLHPFFEDLPQADVQGPDQVDGRCAKVAGAARLVGLHDGQPVGPIGIVAAAGRLALPVDLHRPWPGNHQGQARGHADGLL